MLVIHVLPGKKIMSASAIAFGFHLHRQHVLRAPHWDIRGPCKPWTILLLSLVTDHRLWLNSESPQDWGWSGLPCLNSLSPPARAFLARWKEQLLWLFRCPWLVSFTLCDTVRVSLSAQGEWDAPLQHQMWCRETQTWCSSRDPEKQGHGMQCGEAQARHDKRWGVGCHQRHCSYRQCPNGQLKKYRDKCGESWV